MAIAGPVDAWTLAESLAVGEADANAALLDLETQGVVLRGYFTTGAAAIEWCDRRLLARIHRSTVEKLRREIDRPDPLPCSPSRPMRMVGRPNSSTIREATIPITPGCQPSSARTMP